MKIYLSLGGGGGVPSTVYTWYAVNARGEEYAVFCQGTSKGEGCKPTIKKNYEMDI